MTGSHEKAQGLLDRLLKEVENVIVGKRDRLERFVLALLSDGHVLLEDVPGLAKTLTVRTFAQALGLPFQRIQFTPDLMPADVTGSFYFDLEENQFELRRGPIFTNIVLADEINRAPPKTQSALLEAMQEGQATLEGHTHHLPEPFFVFATQNPIETEGTYPLPEAQLDRFLLQSDMGYPEESEEVEILRRHETRHNGQSRTEQVLSKDDLLALQRLARQVRLDEELKTYVVRVVQRTRESDALKAGASPRGSLAVHQLAKAHALLEGRGYVIPHDVKQVLEPALAHRLILGSEARARGIDPSKLLMEMASEVPVPDVVPRAPDASKSDPFEPVNGEG